MSEPRAVESFYLRMAVAISATAFLGFSFTYFGPVLRGEYPPVSPMVHLHGWSFFAWYLLLPVQAGLIRTGRVRIHRALGLSSMALATIMVAAGLVVALVQIDRSLGPEGSPFWALMGLPILSTLILFAIFYVVAIRRRRRPADHKRLMLLASAAALSAATFRILVWIFGFEPWVWIVGFSVPILFVFAGMFHDHRHERRIHPVYLWGAPAMVGLAGGMFLLVSTPRGDAAKLGLASIGRWVVPLY